MKKSTVAILGVGEVGFALAKVFSKKFTVLKKDLRFDEVKNRKIDVLHICIPYTSSFIKTVISQLKKNRPNLIIIHSTVIPRTTSNIYERMKIPIVHSPVMGTHPYLVKDILKFKKFIGPVNKKAAFLAKKHLNEVGIKTVILNNPLESELGKLLDTTYYAWNIIFNKKTHKLCQDLGVDFESVYTSFNTVYNQGYLKTKPNVIRPILNFQKGPIGGHCLIPNTILLDSFKKNLITKVIIRENNKERN